MNEKFKLWYGLLKKVMISKGFYRPNKDYRDLLAIIIRSIRNKLTDGEITGMIRDYIMVSKTCSYQDIRQVIQLIRFDIHSL